MWTEKNMIGRKTEEQKDALGVLHAEEVPAGTLQINTENMTKEDLEKLKAAIEKAMSETAPVLEAMSEPGIPEPSVKEYGTVEEAVDAIKEEMQKEGVDHITVLSVEAEEKVDEEKTEEVQEEIQEVGGFGLKMKVTRKGNEMLFTGLNYEAEKPAEKAEEPEVVPVDVLEEERPVMTQEGPAVIVMGGGLPDAEYTAEEVQEEIAEMEKASEDPEPCPFCGAQVKLTYYKRWHVTGHDPRCFLSPNFNVGKTKEQIIIAWNSRSW